MSNSETPEREMIISFIESLRKEQFFDKNFEFRQSKEANMESWSAFCAEFQENLDQVSKSLSNEEIDFKDVDSTVKKMKENATRLGCERLVDACAALEQLSGDGNNDGCKCKEAFDIITDEYYIVRDCFHMILQVERTTLFTNMQ